MNFTVAQHLMAIGWTLFCFFGGYLLGKRVERKDWVHFISIRRRNYG